MPFIVEQLNICDVCRLLDKDMTPKARHYCSLCSSWICEQDANNWWRRAKAAVKRKLEPDFKGDPNYKTGISEIDSQVGL